MAELHRRREDYEPITGLAHYVDDLRPPERRPPALHMAVVRSPYGHATIDHVRLEAARAQPGVVAAFAGAELVHDLPPLGAVPQPGLNRPERRPLAVDRVRYVGDPVAVVLAEDRYVAADARDLVEVVYTPLPAVTDPEAALAPDAPLLYEEFGANVAFRSQLRHGDIQAAFAQADRIVGLRLVNQRLAPSSIEPRACMFDFDPASGELAAWLSSQAIYRAREALAGFLGLDPRRVRVRNATVGGAFGAKNVFVGEELIAAALAMKLARPVKWIEERSENLQAQTQGRGQINYVEAACSNDGRLLALRVRSLGDLGAFLVGVTAMVPARTPSMLGGPYQVQAVDSEVVGVFTNKVPTAPYRGAGRPEAAYILERTMDRLARELDRDPAEVRRRNFLPPDVFPYTSVTGLRYDSGNYQAVLDRLLALADYAGWRARQRAQRAAGDPTLLGIGLATFIETTGEGSVPAPGVPQEAATVRVRRDGTILVQSGVAHTGQGHFTAFAQIAAEAFNLPASSIEVRMNDAALPAFGIGTFASRTTLVAGSAVRLAAEAVRAKAVQVAAEVLEVAPADLVMEQGQVLVRGAPTRAVALGELARLVEEQPDLVEREQPNPVNGAPVEGLAAWRDFVPPSAAVAFGAHLAVVAVDTGTGEVQLRTYVAVDDCGRVLNHALAEAQVHGSLAQGIGQALYEGTVYDETGQLLTGTLMDYAVPRAEDIPSFVTAFVETPSPNNPLGAKGVGEAGCIGAPPAIVNAVLDALAPLGITTIDMPLTPEKIWALVQAARQGGPQQPDPTLPPIFTAGAE
jgi:carbon-monoxide dehydrogenase large subunit